MTVKINLGNVQKKLEELGKLDNLRKPLTQSETYLEGSIGKRFRAGGGSMGRWSPLKASTIARHPRRAGGKPLSDTGKLKMSVTSGHAKQLTKRQLRYKIGSGVKYANVHNFGYKQIPARPFMYVDNQDEQAIKKIFEDYIKGLVR